MQCSFGLAEIVVWEEEPEDDDVHEEGFGEGEDLASQPPDALTQSEVEAFDMIGLSFLFSASLMLFFG